MDLVEDTGTVLALIKSGELVDEAVCGETVEVITSDTPCYGESGGQVGDIGCLRVSGGGEFEVADTRKQAGTVFAHIGAVKAGELHIGDHVSAEVDTGRRGATALNHSATHLLHAALRSHLGEHATQAGSYVAPDHLRFDFHHDDDTRQYIIVFGSAVVVYVQASTLRSSTPT